MTLRNLTLLSALLAASCASAWNDTGHRAIGLLAEKRLTDKAKERVAEILKVLPAPTTPEFTFQPPDVFLEKPFPGLRDGFVALPGTLADACPWPDNVRQTWMDRPGWHYINLPIIGDGGTAKNPPEINVASVLPRLVLLLQDPSRSKETKAAAIAWIGHLVGDIQMPLHAVAFFDPKHPNGDRGGNDYFQDAEGKAVRENRLHGYWDGLPGNGDPSEVVKRIDALPVDPLPSYPLKDVAKTVMEWAEESKKIAEDYVYRQAGPGSPMLDTDQTKWDEPGYRKVCAPIADLRIKVAGDRLAALLNAIFEN